MIKEKLVRGLSGAKEKTKQGAAAARRGFLNFLWRRDPAEYFVALLILGFLVFSLRCIIGGTWVFTEIFHKNCADQFMDFFHSLRDVSRGTEVYSVQHVIYPPLANVVLWVMSRMVPAEYLASGSAEAVTVWHNYPAAIMALVVFTVLSLVTLALIIHREKYPPVLRNLLTFFTIASFPIIFMVERGNVVVICLMALLVYAQNYNSESRKGRELGIFMLALAAALKIYPALFGLVLLKDKRYREAIRAAIYAVVLFVVPSFFFGGPFFCIKWVIRNTINYSNFAGQDAINYVDNIGGTQALGKLALYGLYIIAVLFLVFFSLVQKKGWKTWMLTGAILLTVPSIFSMYNWVLMMPALFTFLRTEKLRGINWLYFFAMTLPFYVFIPKAWQDNGVIGLMAIIIAASVVEGVILFHRFFKEKKAAKKAELAES